VILQSIDPSPTQPPGATNWPDAINTVISAAIKGGVVYLAVYWIAGKSGAHDAAGVATFVVTLLATGWRMIQTGPAAVK